MRRGIASRIAVIFSSLLIIAAGTTGYMVYQAARDALIDASSERLMHATDLVRVRLQTGINGMRNDVDFLTSTPPVPGIVRARMLRGLDPETALLDSEWRGQFAAIIQVFLEDRSSYLRASFVDLRYQPQTLVAVERAGTDDAPAVELPAPAEVLSSFLRTDTLRTAGLVHFSEIQLLADPRGGRPVPALHAATPVFDASGQLFGAVTVSIDLRDLLSTLSSLVGPDNTLFVGNDDGHLLNSPGGPYVTEQPDPSAGASFPILAGSPGGVHLLNDYVDADGEATPGIAYFERLPYDLQSPGHAMNVAVVAPRAVILEGVGDVERRSIFIVLLFSIGGALLAVGFSRFLTRPLSRIIGAVAEFGEGRPCADLPVQRSDEIGVLAQAFATMAEQIHTQIETLEEKERRQRTILETAAEAIIVADANGLVEVFNPAAERLFGYGAEEVAGEHVTVLLPRADADASASEEVWRVIGTGHEAVGRCKDGAEVSVSISVSAFSVAQDHKFALFLVDITARKEYEAALRQAKLEAEEMARLKTNFLANMSHEIRTPLTAVIGFASTLASELHDQHAHFAQLIERSSRRLMDTLNAVLSLAQLESQQMTLELDCLNVAREVEDVAQFFETHAADKGLDLRYGITAAARQAHAQLDRGALGSILQNLLGNAIKFTDRGYVEIAVDADDAQVFVHVKDTGIGIKESFLPFLFDAFRQESSGMDRSHEGSGLGLALTKRLVDLMQGAVTVASVKGEGTTFSLTFPRVHVDEADAPALLGGSDRAVELRPDWGAKILVIDDNIDTAFLVRNVLSDLGDVTLAFDAPEALRKVDQIRYDVVLLDINLGSGASGVELLQEIRDRPAYTDIPIFALTAYALPGDRERFLQLGFDDYVSKPFAPEALERLVYNALQQPAA